MFLPIRFKTHIQLPPHDLNGNFDEIIAKKMSSKLEGVCSRFGYIKPGSLEVVRRSAGMFMKQHFNGHIRFDIYCKGEVCNPPQGMVVEAIVKNKNALGLLAESTMIITDEISGNEKAVPVLDIIVPKKAAGIASEIDLEEVQIGDSINVMVMGKRYQLNDTNISIIGRAVKHLEPRVHGDVDPDTIDATVADGADDDIIEDTEGIGEEDYVSDDDGNTVVAAPVRKLPTRAIGGIDLDGFDDGGDAGLDDEDELDDDFDDEAGEDDDFSEGGGYEDFE